MDTLSWHQYQRSVIKLVECLNEHHVLEHDEILFYLSWNSKIHPSSLSPTQSFFINGFIFLEQCTVLITCHFPLEALYTLHSLVFRFQFPVFLFLLSHHEKSTCNSQSINLNPWDSGIPFLFLNSSYINNIVFPGQRHYEIQPSSGTGETLQNLAI